MPLSAAANNSVKLLLTILSLCVSILVHFCLFYLRFMFLCVSFITYLCVVVYFSCFFCVVSDLPKFCFECGENIDSDPYVVVYEQAHNPFVGSNDLRLFIFRLYYHTSCYNELFPMRATSNEAVAASSHAGPTVDNYGRPVSSSLLERDGDHYDFGVQAEVGESADTEEEETDAEENAEDANASAFDGRSGSEEELGA